MPNAEDAEKLIGPRTRAIVLISPNNPTGAVYPRATIHAFYELAKKHGIALLLDETYKDFLPEGERPHALFDEPDWQSTLVHLYSFSKVFALTGYRVGGVTAGAKLMAEIEKAMDCVSICPPRLGQEAALYGLRNLLPWARKNTEGLKARADLLGQGCRSPTAGGWSALAPTSPMSSIPSPTSPRPKSPSGSPTRRTCSPFPATCSAQARNASSDWPSPMSRTTRSPPCWSASNGSARKIYGADKRRWARATEVARAQP